MKRAVLLALVLCQRSWFDKHKTIDEESVAATGSNN